MYYHIPGMHLVFTTFEDYDLYALKVYSLIKFNVNNFVSL